MVKSSVPVVQRWRIVRSNWYTRGGKVRKDTRLLAGAGTSMPMPSRATVAQPQPVALALKAGEQPGSGIAVKLVFKAHQLRPRRRLSM